MCRETKLVPIPEFLKADYQYIFDDKAFGSSREFDFDEQGRQCFALDACIAPVVELLWQMGVRTTGCCCGHGSGHAVVSVEVPNGGDIERRDAQTRHFYEQTTYPDVPIHEFRGSTWNEVESYGNQLLDDMIRLRTDQ